MNSFEPVFWMACAAIVLRILNGGDRRLWLLFGFIAGLGILNKHSMLFFGSGIAVGLLLTAARREYNSRWIWIAAAISLFLFLPNLRWEIQNGWPTIALLRSVIGTKYIHISPWEYVWQQSLLTHPVATPLWLAGLWYLFRDSAGKKYAVLGLTYLAVLVEMILLHGKIYYLAPAYIMLFAAGAAWIELRLLSRTGTWLPYLIVAPLLVGVVVAAPLAMPILSVDATIKYTRFWDVKAVHVENVPQGDLPQLFGDMFGWQEQVGSVASVYNSLPAVDRRLRRSRRHRLLRPRLWSSESDQRPQSIRPIGTPRLHGGGRGRHRLYESPSPPILRGSCAVRAFFPPLRHAGGDESHRLRLPAPQTVPSVFLVAVALSQLTLNPEVEPSGGEGPGDS